MSEVLSKREAIKAAASVAEDVATGRLDPSELEAQALKECRALFSYVAGPGDPLWPLHVDVAKQVLALDGIPYNELVEWVGVHGDRPQELEHAEMPAEQPESDAVED